MMSAGNFLFNLNWKSHRCTLCCGHSPRAWSRKVVACGPSYTGDVGADHGSPWTRAAFSRRSTMHRPRCEGVRDGSNSSVGSGSDGREASSPLGRRRKKGEETEHGRPRHRRRGGGFQAIGHERVREVAQKVLGLTESAKEGGLGGHPWRGREDSARWQPDTMAGAPMC